MTTTLHKTFRDVTVKDEAKGLVSAVFATLNVIDADGDVTLPGAFTDGAKVVISAYGHRSWDGELPLGTGTIREDGDEAIFEGKFFIDTTHGRDAFLTVKELSEAGLQEWSYSLENVVSERSEWDGREVNLLKRITVKEVSPVLRGAGVNTRTLAAKGAPTKFADHVEVALRALDEVVPLAVARLTERQATGKSTDEQREALGALDAALDPLRAALDATPPSDPEPPATTNPATVEWLRAVRSNIAQEA